MIRFLLVALTLFSFLILSIPMLIYYHFLGKKNPDKKNWQCLKIVQFMFLPTAPSCMWAITAAILIFS